MSAELNDVMDLLAVPSRQRKRVSLRSDIEPVLRQGVPGRALDNLARALKVPITNLSPILGISERAFYNRRRSATLGAPLVDRIYRIADVLTEASTVLGDRERAVLWMTTPVPALGGATPLARLDTEIGTARVREVLGAIKYGIYV